MRLFILLALLLATPVFAGNKDLGIGPAEQRVALVIGNGAYRNSTPLVNPAHDARLMAATLEATGFRLIGGRPLIDADKNAIEGAIRAFGQALRTGAVGLFYYSGHGLQVKGQNYLVPVGARIAGESDIKYELVDVAFVLDEMANAGNRLNIVILDACRTNPFGFHGAKDVTSGLAQVTAPAGTVISYATQPGNVASDGSGDDSPYTQALSAVIGTAGLDVFATFNQVGLMVKQATGGQQQPWLATSPIEGNFYFSGGGVASSQPLPPPGAAPPPTTQNGDFTLEDIAAREAAAKAKWEKRQAEMRVAFEMALAFQGTGEARREVWDRFLAAYGEKNPYSAEDDRLRAEAANYRMGLTSSGGGPPPGSLFHDCPDCPEMRVIGQGSFLMGSDSRETAREGVTEPSAGFEQPRHQVTVRRFAIGRFPVLRGEFAQFVRDTGYDPSGCFTFNGTRWSSDALKSWRDPGFSQSDRDPVVCVSFEDAQHFVDWLNSKLIGRSLGRYRLPTEAEWEYAARAGTQTARWWGDDIGTARAVCKGCGSPWDSRQTAPAGSFAANPFGLQDMLGNVLEWTADCWHDGYAGAPTDGSVWLGGACDRRTVRGGAWISKPSALRSAKRTGLESTYRTDIAGFRVAKAFAE